MLGKGKEDAKPEEPAGETGGKSSPIGDGREDGKTAGRRASTEKVSSRN